MASFFLRSLNNSILSNSRLKASSVESVNADSNDDNHTTCDQNELLQPLTEKSEYGVCQINLSTWNKRTPEDNHVITPKGAIIHGESYNSESMRTGKLSIVYTENKIYF